MNPDVLFAQDLVFPKASEWLKRLDALILDLEAQAARIRSLHERIRGVLENGITLSSLEWSFMFRKRITTDKEEAKKLFFSYRKKGSVENSPEEIPPKEPETTEEKIAMIMDYMKETSAKLDRIEDDITYLKQQVDEIKKKI